MLRSRPYSLLAALVQIRPMGRAMPSHPREGTLARIEVRETLAHRSERRPLAALRAVALRRLAGARTRTATERAAVSRHGTTHARTLTVPAAGVRYGAAAFAHRVAATVPMRMESVRLA